MKNIDRLYVIKEDGSELAYLSSRREIDIEIILNPAIDTIKINEEFYEIKRRCLIGDSKIPKITNDLLILVKRIPKKSSAKGTIF